MRYLFLLLLSIGCNEVRQDSEIGKKYTSYSLRCVKKQSSVHPTIGFDGKLGMGISTNCLISLCYKVTRTFAKNSNDDTFESVEVDIHKCL